MHHSPCPAQIQTRFCLLNPSEGSLLPGGFGGETEEQLQVYLPGLSANPERGQLPVKLWAAFGVPQERAAALLAPFPFILVPSCFALPTACSTACSSLCPPLPVQVLPLEPKDFSL